MYESGEDPLGLLFTVGFGIIFSLMVAIYASNRNKSGLLWFVISFLISPLIAFLILYFTTRSPSENTPTDDRVSLRKTDEIKALWDLKQAGAITEEEFSAKKQKLLS